MPDSTNGVPADARRSLAWWLLDMLRPVVVSVVVTAVGLDARSVEGAVVADFDWKMPARFRVPEVPDQEAPSDATRYFDGPVTPASWRIELNACASSGPVISFRWELDGVPVVTTPACDGASLTVDAEGRYEVTLTVTDDDGSTASLTREIQVEDWLVVGLGDSYGSGEGSPDEPVSLAQIDAVGTARDALAAAQAAAAQRLAAWVVARDDLAALVPLVNDALAKLAAWESAVAARNDACNNFPPTPVLCAQAQLAASDAAGRLVVALTRLGLQGLFGTPNVVAAIANLRASAEHALSVATALRDAANAAVTAAGATLAQALRALGPRWQDRRCHRSARSGQVQAASLLEAADPHTSVTFIHLACSGATVWEGLLREYEGQEPGPSLPPQIATAVALAGRRPIDALVVSIGGNDVNFAHVVTTCLWQVNCFETPARDDPAASAYVSEICGGVGPLAELCADAFGILPRPFESAESQFLGGGTACGGSPGDDVDEAGLDDLSCNYAAVEAELEKLRAQGDLRGLFEDDGRVRLYLTAYPGITRREPATPGGPTEPCGYDPAAPAEIRARNLPGVLLPEILWAESFVVPQLAGVMQASAARHGWRFVDDHVAAFDGHGYCAIDNWIVRLGQSLRTQARVEPLLSSLVGSVHPNPVGHAEYALAISRALLCDFSPGCSPATSSTTTTTTSSTTTTTIPPECARAEDCDDGNPCTDDGCTSGRCQRTNRVGPCDDGNVCTAGDACADGACVGAVVDAAVVASLLGDATALPDSCRQGRDTRRAQRIMRPMTSARRALAKVASAGGARKHRLIGRAAAKLHQAGTRLDKLERVLSGACHAALTELVAARQGQTGCLR